MSRLKHLFSPIKVGDMEVKNRLVMSPMGINFGFDEDGMATEQLAAYFEARARGGTGMLIVGGGAVEPLGLELPNLPRLWDDAFIGPLRRVTETVHRYDTAFGMQLLHGGAQRYHEDRVAPSAIPSKGMDIGGAPKAMSLEDIQHTVGAYGDSARRCREAGFDFVEIHAAHGYLINEFLAPWSNQRDDGYGGSFENRVRFLLEVVNSVLRETGPDFTVGIRISGDDHIEGGWTVDDSVRLAPILEREGAAYLNVSASVYGASILSVPSMYVDQGCFVHLAEAVKRTVSIPVMTVGRIKRPEMADQIIRDGKADMVVMGRAHLADPDIARKAEAGNLDGIRPCIGCCVGCIDPLYMGEGASCVMNPEVGREYLLPELTAVEVPRRVLVIGAGPAGLAVARMAALRGHDVVVCDVNERIGGMVRLAAVPPKRAELSELVEYYERELARLQVEVRLSTPVDRQLMESVQPEVVVVATGAQPEIPQIDGLYDTEMDLSTVVDVLSGAAELGDRVVVLGGNQAGLATADHLAEQGKEVTVLHRDAAFAPEMPVNDRFSLRQRLRQGGVKLFKNVVIREFLPHGVVFESKGDAVTLDAVSDIVISEGMRSDRTVANLVKQFDVEVYVIGDAKSPRNLLHSQSEADEVGRAI